MCDKNTICFWLKSVISEAYKPVSDSDCTAVKVRVLEVKCIGF